MAGLGRNRVKGACWSAQTAHKSVLTSSAKVLKAYCPKIYTMLTGTPMSNATFVFPMNWRFFPTRDPQVDVYLSRDLDSEFNEREIAGK